ncbi:hypothetical protein B0H11DRAFT_2275840 [Mycena galericulata]|nr:hypothetical protein B0H11DRAFT_2275840 [Mycena galericulata]
MTSIPHELVAAIVDELEDDRVSLKACSVVTSAFCPPSQRHLFRSMWLHRENWKHYTPAQRALHKGTLVPSGTIKSAYALLSESPHLAGYVRDLTIDLPESANEDMPLEHVLRVVSNLERLVISGMVVRWDELTPPLASSILDVLARPALGSLHLLNMRNFPIAPIHRALSSMRVLSIHHTTLISEEEEDETPRNTMPLTGSCLEELILNTSLPSTFAAILSPDAPHLTRVRKLALYLGAGHLADKLLMSLARTLLHLELVCGAPEFPLSSHTLSVVESFTNLRSLKLRIFCGLRRRLPDEFAEILASLPRTSISISIAIQDSLSGGEWIDEGPILGPSESRVESLNCQVVFLDPPHKASSRDVVFNSFCSAIRNMLPGFKINVERVDEEPSYIGRLPQ